MTPKSDPCTARTPLFQPSFSFCWSSSQRYTLLTKVIHHCLTCYTSQSGASRYFLPPLLQSSCRTPVLSSQRPPNGSAEVSRFICSSHLMPTVPTTAPPAPCLSVSLRGRELLFHLVSLTHLPQCQEYSTGGGITG